MAKGLEDVAALPEPIGEIISSSVRPNGLEVQKVRVPLGVIFFIYESRPNVTADAAALCVKAGNAVILRGGKEAAHSNAAIAAILAEAAVEARLPDDAIQLVNTTDRAAVGRLLHMPEYDQRLHSPRRREPDPPRQRGSPHAGHQALRRQLPRLPRPVGRCRTWPRRSSSTPSVSGWACATRPSRWWSTPRRPAPCCRGSARRCWIAASKSAATSARCELLPAAKPAAEADFAAEYLGPIISCKVVDSLDEAIEHINRYSSQHTEAIVTRDLDAARQFAARIDSSAVMINASTRFNDGGEFGLGAEIGISTDKFHARGPCGINELTSYKYVVYGHGQVRG